MSDKCNFMWTNERTYKSLEWLQVVKLQKDCYNYCYDCMNWKSQNWLQVSARLGNSTTNYRLRWQHKSYQDLTHIVALMSLVGTCKDLQVRKKFILFYWWKGKLCGAVQENQVADLMRNSQLCKSGNLSGESVPPIAKDRRSWPNLGLEVMMCRWGHGPW